MGYFHHGRLIYALGIPHIGQQTAKDIATAFGDDFLEFWTYLKSQAGNATILFLMTSLIQDAPVTGQTNEQEIAERITSIPGIGPVSLDSLLKFAALYVPGTEGSKPSLNPLRADVEKLIQHLKLNKSAPEESSSGKNFSLFLSGKHVVLSGKLTSMTRNEAIDLVERHGKFVSISPSSKCF